MLPLVHPSRLCAARCCSLLVLGLTPASGPLHLLVPPFTPTPMIFPQKSLGRLLTSLGLYSNLTYLKKPPQSFHLKCQQPFPLTLQIPSLLYVFLLKATTS